MKIEDYVKDFNNTARYRAPQKNFAPCSILARYGTDPGYENFPSKFEVYVKAIENIVPG
jgi:hypothetical protein